MPSLTQYQDPFSSYQTGPYYGAYASGSSYGGVPAQGAGNNYVNPYTPVNQFGYPNSDPYNYPGTYSQVPYYGYSGYGYQPLPQQFYQAPYMPQNVSPVYTGYQPQAAPPFGQDTASLMGLLQLLDTLGVTPQQPQPSASAAAPSAPPAQPAPAGGATTPFQAARAAREAASTAQIEKLLATLSPSDPRYAQAQAALAQRRGTLASHQQLTGTAAPQQEGVMNAPEPYSAWATAGGMTQEQMWQGNYAGTDYAKFGNPWKGNTYVGYTQGGGRTDDWNRQYGGQSAQATPAQQQQFAGYGNQGHEVAAGSSGLRSTTPPAKSPLSIPNASYVSQGHPVAPGSSGLRTNPMPPLAPTTTPKYVPTSYAMPKLTYNKTY